MSQGTRGRIRRAAIVGIGLLVGSGLTGCMDDKKLPTANKSPGPGLRGTPTIDGASATRPGGSGGPAGVNVNSVGGGMPSNGVQTAGGTMPGGSSGTNYGGANPNNFGAVGTPTRQGYGTAQGSGQQPTTYGQQPTTYGQPSGYNPGGVVPSVTPNTGGYQVPSGYQGTANPTAGAARAQASDPSPPALNDLGPIPPSQPAGHVPSVVPANFQPVNPPSPMAPMAPPYPGSR
jgi:hypothetical protein